MAKETHVSEILAHVFKRGGMVRGVRKAQAVLSWPQVAGSQLARFTRARALVDGVLIVEVPDSETAMHLTLQRQRFVDALRGRHGARDVRDIRFQTGRSVVEEERQEESSGEARQRVDSQELSRLTSALGELDLPEELSGTALEAARSMLAYRARRKAEGWKECTTCGALTPQSGLCDACRRYAGEPLVRAAADRLAVEPEEKSPQLSDEQRAVAELLAREQLQVTVRELLPHVLAKPELRPQLEAAARCLLSLTLHKPRQDLTDQDILALPQRIARVLGYWSNE